LKTEGVNMQGQINRLVHSALLRLLSSRSVLFKVCPGAIRRRILSRARRFGSVGPDADCGVALQVFLV
jgi:hypothetical protein